ncbi:phosphonate ABC transporter substrate-binding protein [Advenella sp. WQ 585]|uniref:Phosphonate ABC transporter substrate-binding protein n=1 Tax=Advenella mandrilli TaxID=2800330 RepID=A0ABS1EE50_9BURK|nr:phosphonate ABC transporter substrate-binding protein [Advenella mandrilli]MBK1781929.1 phosphonate ABC transporter substrate-binding protein [Advenella mandrilli]
MIKSISQRVGISLLAAALTAGAAYAQDKKEINFGIISTESSQNLRQLWDPFLADMSKKTGYEIKAFFAPDYAGIIQGMRFDKVDIAWYGNKSAMEAVDRANGEVIYQTVDKDGKPGYWSLLIAHKDSPINNVEDMLKNAKSLNFGNGDPNSTSGFLVPSYYVFAQNNVDPSKIFKRTVNANHEVNALSVANKQVDVATNNTESLDRLHASNPEKAAQIKEIWRSPLIASDPIVWRKNLPEEVKTKFTEFFDTYGDKPEELAVLHALSWAKFKPSSNDQLLPIRQLELFKQRNQVAADEKLSDADKQTQLKKLDEDLEKLAASLKAMDAKQS